MKLASQVLINVMVVTILYSQLSLGKNNGTERKVKDGRVLECSDNNMCPTWFVCNSQNYCQCGNGQSNIIICDDKTLTSAVLGCNCVTYDNETGSTFAGKCVYNCENHHSQSDGHLGYYTLPNKPQLLLLNTSFCNFFHRTGLLCGNCEEGHNPLVLSYNLSCVECPDGHKNWWKFILVAFVPLTFFTSL